MGRLAAAFRVFFKTLFDAGVAAQVEQVLTGKGLPGPAAAAPKLAAEKPAPPKPVEPPKPTQNPAVTLLAALQREARLIDFLKEDLSAYSDDQIGAAVREVQRDSAKVLDRLFGLQAILTEDEGATIEIPVGFDAGRYRLSGQVTGAGPYRGALRHHGWEVTRCDLPTFTGSTTAANTVAAAEVEVS